MLGIRTRFPAALISVLALSATSLAAVQSHPPMRPLPAPLDRPMSDGPARFVDSARGDDTFDGSRTQPWKTLSIAVSKLAAGDTLYLRGGTYYDHVRVTVHGTRMKPVTIR
ncbi:MAG: hypothetical protein O3B13_08155, partial [Planctomycetota bacterium]|nr:hypothetical protein [Planctomycetota bacterium]